MRRISDSLSTKRARPNSCPYAEIASSVLDDAKSPSSSPNSLLSPVQSGIFLPGGTSALIDIPAPTTGNHLPVTRSSSTGFGKCGMYLADMLASAKWFLMLAEYREFSQQMHSSLPSCAWSMPVPHLWPCKGACASPDLLIVSFRPGPI